jgi:ABC-2 type transport system ATP-binding protein
MRIPSMTPAISVRDLVKTYGSLRAVDGLTFEVPRGCVFGLLGPNGAGKSTTIEMIEGLRRPTSGSIEVLGIDVRRHPTKVKQRIGVQLQSTSFYPRLTVRAVLELFASFFDRSSPVADLIAAVNLEEKADVPTGNLSGGQRQRLAAAVALVNDPDIVFLDEPTTGLDPQARRALWDIICNLRGQGKTVMLTTHYLDEAEKLCDEIAIIDHGRIIAHGSPLALIAENFQRAALEFATNDRLLPSALEQLPGVKSLQSVAGESSTLYTGEVARTTAALFALAEAEGVKLNDLSIRTATLEDVFLKLTGRHLRE